MCYVRCLPPDTNLGPRMMKRAFLLALLLCVGALPELDFGGKRNADGQGFAAFGRVVKGMEVVRKINECPAKEQTLTPGVRIGGVRRK